MFFVQSAVATEDFTVAVASNFLLPAKMLKKEFESENDVKINVASASTSKLYAQIKQGAPFDVFLSADQETIDLLVSEKFAKSDNIFLYARGRLVLWVPGSANPQSNFEQGAIHKMVIPNPKLAPYGKAAMEVLDKYPQLQNYKNNLIYAENVSQSMQYVFQQNVEAGFVAFSQLKSLKIDSGVWIIPETLYSRIDQYGVVLSQTKNQNLANKFVNFMKAEITQKKLVSEFGYLSISN